VQKLEYPTLDNLLDLKISKGFINFILNERETINELRYWCEQPIIDWPFYIPDDVTKVVCLWSRNGDIEACWEKNQKIEFISIYHDQPEWDVIGNEFQIMTDLLIHLIEAEDWEDEESTYNRLQEISTKLGYDKFSELNEFHKKLDSTKSIDAQVNEFTKKWAMP